MNRAHDRWRLLGSRSELRRGGTSVFFGPLEFAMLRMIAKAKSQGIHADRIFAGLYQGDPNGGPMAGRNVVHARRVGLNHKLARVGLRIVSSKYGAGTVYELRETGS